jgi:DNA end-binding protein Ku
VSIGPSWRGYLKLSLVSCPIALHVACSSSERVSFRQINRKTGNRLRQQLVDEVTREPVGAEDKARGYEIGRGQYLLIEDEELEAIEIESTRTIEIDRFVPRSRIDQRFFDTPYYVTPNGPVGQDAFAVIREAMRTKGLVALGRIVLAKRERVMALEPYSARTNKPRRSAGPRRRVGGRDHGSNGGTSLGRAPGGHGVSGAR